MTVMKPTERDMPVGLFRHGDGCADGIFDRGHLGYRSRLLPCRRVCDRGTIIRAERLYHPQRFAIGNAIGSAATDLQLLYVMWKYCRDGLL